MPPKGKGKRSPVAPRAQDQTALALRYSLNCFDPRYPLGYPLKRSNDFSELRTLCDAENVKCVDEGTFVQFWIVANGRYIYPPEFSSEVQANEESTEEREIRPRGAA